MTSVMARFRQSAERQLLFNAIWRSSPWLAGLWWCLVVVRAVLPTAFAVVMGALVSQVQNHGQLTLSLIGMGLVFVAMQTLGPFHSEVGLILGMKTRGWLHDKLASAVYEPPGIAHLERPELMDHLTLAREFDLGMTGPTLAECMSFLGSSLAQSSGGIVAALSLGAYTWWAPLLVLFAWLSPHFLLREGNSWREWRSDEVKEHQRHADYAYKMAVDRPSAKELRLFNLRSWVVERYVHRRRVLLDIVMEAIRLRERSLVWTMLAMIGTNGLLLSLLAVSAWRGGIGLGTLISFVSLVVAASGLGSMDFGWWLSTAARPVPVVLDLRERMRSIGALPSGTASARGLPQEGIRFHEVTFQYHSGGSPVLRELNLEIPAGQSLAIVGQNGAGKTTLAKLLCRLYDPQSGVIEADGVDLRAFDLASWRSRVAAIFQDFVRYQLTLRDNVALLGAPDDLIWQALAQAGAAELAGLDTVMSKEYPGGTDLSGGQWQRVALARLLCSVRQGAGLIILDEPTAQLDVRGEAEIFGRLLDLTRGCTTVLISHRFSSVRKADRICVIEDGQVAEQGSHEELMSLHGRYRTMFDLQAARFTEDAGRSSEDVAEDAAQITEDAEVSRERVT
jgi:ATP-binding cassette, subfamily B, bacterial